MTLIAPSLTAVSDTSVAAQVVVIAHGSPDPRHSGSVSRLGQRLTSATGFPTQVSFLEHDVPTAADTLTRPAEPDTTTIVVPLLLTAGFHWHSDIPAVVAHAGSRSVLLPPPHPVLFRDAVVDLVGSAGHVVLASAGSSRPEIVTRFAALADSLVTPDRAVDVCLSPTEIARTARPGSVVVPVLTADGLFADRIRRTAASAGATTTDVLGDTIGFAAALAALVTSIEG